ncbi:Hsp20/alpha crystallin family protein [delta proteobacterium NaphS2]|nr:Hsp20/alpha crystallin family protein [delta proteobacterium NaphS2]
MSELILWMDREINKMRRDVDRLFKESWPEIGVGIFKAKVSQQIPIETYMTEDSFIVRAILPGIDPQSLDISVTDYQLNIKGSRKEESETDDGYSRHMQRKLRSFYRSVPLPFKVASENIKATLKMDVLTIKMTKADPQKKRYIKIEFA